MIHETSLGTIYRPSDTGGNDDDDSEIRTINELTNEIISCKKTTSTEIQVNRED